MRRIAISVLLTGLMISGVTSGSLFAQTDYTVLHSFGSGDDGAWPYGSLITDGSNLYGMTYQGGAPDEGTIFSINKEGADYTLLHEFDESSGMVDIFSGA